MNELPTDCPGALRGFVGDPCPRCGNGPCARTSNPVSALTQRAEEGMRLRHAAVEQATDKLGAARDMAYLSHLDRGELLVEIERLRAGINKLGLAMVAVKELVEAESPQWYLADQVLKLITRDALSGDSSAVETSGCIHGRVVCEPCAQMAVRFHEKTIALAKVISERHTRVNKLLYGPGATAGAVIGPSAADDAHRDRGALLSMLTPEQRGAVEPTAVRDSIAPSKKCSKCQRFFWLDQFDGHDCKPKKASDAPAHKAGDVCEVCGGVWISVSNVGGVAHTCPGSPLNGSDKP